MTKKKTIQIKVWSTATNPIPKVVITDTDSINLYNCIHTQLCTEQRHRQCVREGKCEGMKPRCEWDLFKMAGYSATANRNDYQQSQLKNKCKKIVEKMLNDGMRHCKPYTLTLTKEKCPECDDTGWEKTPHPRDGIQVPCYCDAGTRMRIRNGWLKKPKKKAK